MARSSLLDAVQGLLVRTYRMDPGVGSIGAFVIGDQGYRTLYAGNNPTCTAGAADGSGARTLIRETPDGVHACIYFPNRLIRALEDRPPQYGLDATNVDAFAAFVEEIDHLLCLADGARRRRSVTLFELELHANVSKYLVLSRFMAGREPRIHDRQRVWLRHHLFNGYRFDEPDPAIQSRYRDARRWAVRFLDQLPRLRPPARLRTLRRFHDVPLQSKLRLIRSMETN